MIRILAVDDDKGILALMKRTLEKEGYEVTTVSEPERVRELKLSEYHLILLDVMMPGKDGFTLCEEIRDLTDCPILFLTAKTGEADLMRGLGIGGDDYIKKPFGVGELRARVAAHLRRENREKRHVVSAGGVNFELKAKKVFYKGCELDLTKSEYAICEYLAMNRGQVFSKERIYEYVFGYDGTGDSSAVAEHVKNIRAKFKRLKLEPIETVWGIGYRWKRERDGH